MLPIAALIEASAPPPAFAFVLAASNALLVSSNGPTIGIFPSPSKATLVRPKVLLTFFSFSIRSLAFASSSSNTSNSAS
jgi:hypothetical protein